MAFGLWFCWPCGWNGSSETLLGHGVIFLLCCHSGILCLLNHCLWILVATSLHCQVLHSLATPFNLLFRDYLFLDQQPMHLFLNITVPFHCIHYRIHRMPSSLWCFVLYCIGFGMCCPISICTMVMSAFSKVHMPLWLEVRTFLSISWYLKVIVILVIRELKMSVSVHSFFGY